MTWLVQNQLHVHGATQQLFVIIIITNSTWYIAFVSTKDIYWLHSNTVNTLYRTYIFDFCIYLRAKIV